MSSSAGTPNRWTDIGAAVRDVAPIGSGMAALGISFGLLVTHTGLSWWWTPLFSGLIYAGSLEFLLVHQVATGAPLAVIAVTTLLVNGRHVFYGLTFPLGRVRGALGKSYAVFALIDEAYALIAARPAVTMSSGRILSTQALLQVSWLGGGIVGALAGNTLAPHIPAMDFVFTALFIVLAIEAVAACPSRLDIGIAVVAAAIGWWAGSTQMLLVAMTITVAGLLLRSHLQPDGIGDRG